MKYLVILTFLIITTGRTRACNHSYTINKLRNQIGELKELPEYEALIDKNINIIEFTAKDYFLKAYPKKILNKNKRTYNIGINPALFKCPPSDRAMKAILAHELMHLKDYAEIPLAKFGWRYLFYTSQVERETDYRVLKMGYVNGLKEYREWIYPKLDGKKLKKKLKMYYRPDEIELMVLEGEISPLD